MSHTVYILLEMLSTVVSTIFYFLNKLTNKPILTLRALRCIHCRCVNVIHLCGCILHSRSTIPQHPLLLLLPPRFRLPTDAPPNETSDTRRSSFHPDRAGPQTRVAAQRAGAPFLQTARPLDGIWPRVAPRRLRPRRRRRTRVRARGSIPGRSANSGGWL